MIMLNNNLRIFMKVAEKGSITEAADELYISQPAVSKAIKNLEDELCVKLFIRDKHTGLTLTSIGQKILSSAYQMADAENHIYQFAYMENHYLGGRLRIGTAPIFTTCILSEMLPKYRKEYPDIQVEILEGSSGEVREMVMKHQADFGMIFSPFGDLEHEYLFSDKIVAVSSEPLPVKEVNLAAYHDRFIFCERSKETTLDNLPAKSKPDFSGCMIVQAAESVIRLAEHGNGIGILSDLVLSSCPNNLYAYPVCPPIETETGIVAVSFSDLAPAALKFIEMLKTML
ncbi:LysR family transcriptional regulator [Enterocloster bolteae]|uniref:LysR family transcriptional regulator n=1 Tax=Enterocloster bolteae TaxID=208479 RepID=UPI0028DBB410|nr:LysR family transcriptional regulator [Enterocloster bolteae]